MSLVPKFRNPFEFDMLMLEPVHRMMMTGLTIDLEKKKELQQNSIDIWNRDQVTLDKIVGYSDFNVGSPTRCKNLLYKELGLPHRKRRDPKTGRYVLTSNKDALLSLIAFSLGKIEEVKTESARVKWAKSFMACYYIFRIREQRKKISSFLGLHIEAGKLAGEIPFEDMDGKLRSTVSVGGTETARFSHSKTLWDTGVNVATLPRDLRSMFVAADGMELAEFDLNRGESWVYAHLSQDPELLRIHLDGLDFHAETAFTISEVFGDPLTLEWILEHKDDEAYKIRYLGKRTNHATAYRMKHRKGAESINEKSLDTNILVSPREFKKAQELWLDRYARIPVWWQEIEKQLHNTRTMTTPYGRVHQYHDHLNNELYKAATAYVPQSTSVDYLNRGFLRVFHEFEKTGAWDLNVLAQTHDSLLIQYDPRFRDEVVENVIEAMTSELTIHGRTFSIPVEAQCGNSWGTLKAYKKAA